jgi:hypothetical protein
MDMSSDGSLFCPQAVQFLMEAEPSSETGAQVGHCTHCAMPVRESARPYEPEMHSGV